MFEREAEEYVIKKRHIDKTKLPVDFSLRCEFSDDFTDFQKGAQFGYNKCNTELEKENIALKCFIKDLIYENHNTCFQFSNTTCLFNSDYRNRAEELIGEKL